MRGGKAGRQLQRLIKGRQRFDVAAKPDQRHAAVILLKGIHVAKLPPPCGHAKPRPRGKNRGKCGLADRANG
jgi:hypothetical protein